MLNQQTKERIMDSHKETQCKLLEQFDGGMPEKIGMFVFFLGSTYLLKLWITNAGNTIADFMAFSFEFIVAEYVILFVLHFIFWKEVSEEEMQKQQEAHQKLVDGFKKIEAEARKKKELANQ